MSDSVENLLYVGGTKGYRMKIFTTEITDVIRHIAMCLRCKGVMRNPCIIIETGYSIYYRLSRTPDVTCFSCKRKEEEHLLTDNIKRGIAILDVECPLKERGCKWVGKLSGIEGHMESCGEFQLECPQLCDLVTKRSKMEDHTTNHCLMRVVKCEHCKVKLCFKDLEHHFTICQQYPLKCECGENHKRKDIEMHKRDYCQETLIECEYKFHGCNVRFKRGLKEKHGKENQIKHMDLKFQTIEKAMRKLESRNDELAEKNEQLATEVQQVENNNRRMETKMQDLTKEVTLLDELSMYTLVLDWEIEVKKVKNVFSDGPTFTLSKGSNGQPFTIPIKVYTKYRMPYGIGELELVVSVWPVSWRDVFSYQFWTFVVAQDNKLSREHNYRSNKEITHSSASRPFETSMVIARIPHGIMLKYEILRTKVFIK